MGNVECGMWNDEPFVIPHSTFHIPHSTFHIPHSEIMAGSKDVSAQEVFKPLLNNIPSFFFNRYYLVISLFLLWLAFFDKNNLWSQYRIQQTYKKLEKDKVFFQNKLEELKVEKIDMANDKEKFAREEYFMKAADEDVFVIEKE